MPIRITGLNSGLDTETIISALVSSYNYKTEKYKKAQTKLSWKQDAWKTLNTKVYSLYNSVGSMRFSSAYNLKSTTCSDSTKASVTAGSNAPNGTQKLNISQIAQAGYLTGAELDKSTSTSTTLAELGYVGGNGKITVTKGDGSTKQIEVTQGTTVQSFVNSLKEAGLSANYDSVNHRIYVSSQKTGEENDFTLTGADVDGASALYAMGLNVQSDATTDTYAAYAKYAGASDADTKANIEAALVSYRSAMEAYNTANAQNVNLSAAYGYASAYSAMMDALNATSLSDDEKAQMQELLSMTAKERTNSLVDDAGNIYSYKTTDADGNKIYSYTDAGGNEKFISAVVSYEGSDGKTYTLNDDGTYTDGTNTYKATSEKDADGNTLYVNTADENDKITVEKKTTYNNVTPGADDNTYDIDSVATGTFTRASDVLTELKTKSALSDKDYATLTTNVATVKSYEEAKDSLAGTTDPYSRENIIANIKSAYASGTYVDENGASVSTSSNGTSGVNELVNGFATVINANKTTMDEKQDIMDENSVLSSIASLQAGSTEEADAITNFIKQVNVAANISTTVDFNTGAKKIDGQDAIIKLNGVEYKGESNSFSINGLNIVAQAETGDKDEDAITITTQTDTQGIYDKVKDFLTQYNALINELTSLYNADSAKGYEPLTDEEKDSLSDTEIEKWEEKIKASLLRRDDKLEGVMDAMTSAMSKGVSIDGKTYYLSSFGIRTLGFLNAPENEHNAYHIDGDEDDTATSGKSDKLMSAIVSDPDTVMKFMQQLSTNLYNAVGDKMKATTLSSTYTVYNDKEMASEYSDYTDLIKKWEEKLTQQEDYWYNKFSAMETALAKLNSQTSSLSSMLGG